MFVAKKELANGFSIILKMSILKYFIPKPELESLYRTECILQANET